MKKRMRNKKGLSPVVATVLLIAIVVALGLIIFMWFRGFLKEEVTKFSGENIKLACDKITFQATLISDTLNVQNTGETPIFKLKIKSEEGGRRTTRDLETEITGSSWPAYGLNQGAAFSGTYSTEGDKITLIPILIGTTSKGEKREYKCDSAEIEVLVE